MGWAEQKYLGWTAVRVVRVPWPDTRITCNNFGYRRLEPELRFRFFGLGFFRFGLGFFRFGFRVRGFQVFCSPISPCETLVNIWYVI